VLELAELAVAERESWRRTDVREALAGFPRAAERVRFFSMPRVDVSSTEIRDRVRAGRPIRYLVPHDVARLIRVRALYKTEVPTH
jgi:nicotinate-nucleotide adenylyltransferase